jgi:hypothetical protein
MSTRYVGPKCPADHTHGPVLPVKDAASPWGWHCPHSAHDGRLRSHPSGPAPRSRSHFTTAEVEAGQPDAFGLQRALDIGG